MFISVDSPSDETLNRGPLALLLQQQYEFPFGINIVQFSFSFSFFFSTVVKPECSDCQSDASTNEASTIKHSYIHKLFHFQSFLIVLYYFCVKWLSELRKQIWIILFAYYILCEMIIRIKKTDCTILIVYYFCAGHHKYFWRYRLTAYPRC